MSLEDGCATLATFTSQTLVDSLRFVDPNWPRATVGEDTAMCQTGVLYQGSKIPSRWLLAGGGWKHPLIRSTFDVLMQQRFNGQAVIQNAAEISWNPDALEANIFAYLAVRTLQGKPLSLPNTTGVPYPMLGGVVYYPKNRA